MHTMRIYLPHLPQAVQRMRISIKYLFLKREVLVIYSQLQAGIYILELKFVGPVSLDPNAVTGSVRLDYGVQNNTVSESLLGGGVRIKEITFKDGLNDVRKISYDYNEPSNLNKSSGAVDSRQGNLSKDYLFETKKKLFTGAVNSAGSLVNTTTTYHIKSKGANAQLTKGSYIGYKYVKVSEEDNGYSLYSYTTPQDAPSPSGVFNYPFIPYPSLDHKRGQLQKSKIFNENNNQLKEVANIYADFEDTISTSIKVVDDEQCYWTQFYDTYANYISNTPTSAPSCGPFGCGIIFSNCGNIMIWYNDAIESSYTRVTETATKDYTYDASNNQSISERVEQYGYNNINFQRNEVTTYFEGVGSTAPFYSTKTFFPVGGYPSGDYTSTQNAAISKMVTLNKINVPVYTKTYKNTTLLTKSQNIFKEFFPNMVELEEVKTAKGNQGLESRLTYHSYYDNGRVKQVSQKDGSSTVYIWGYNETLPIAKIENATYTEVSSQIANLQNKSNADDDTCTDQSSCDEKNLRTALATLRNSSALSDALVTTFTYDPVKGVTSVTDPTGQTMYYHYDSLNRLEMVTDVDNKVISKNTYNYKN